MDATTSPEAPRPVVRPLVRPTARRSHVPPLGVHVTPDGVDVAVVASHATAVDLCLVDVVDPGLPETDPARYRERRVPLLGPTYGVWHAHVPGVRPGQRYGFRAHGPWDPRAGMRHNPAKLLVDPYARGLVGSVTYGPEVLGAVGHLRGDDPTTPDGRWWVAEPYGDPDPTDSLPFVPHSVVMPPMPQAPPLTRPRVPWAETVVYEAHVRGFTLLDPAVPEPLRGTYAGMAHPATIAYLRDLGITTLELLPIHASVSEPRLVAHGLTNYWGYSTLGFFAPEPRYATRAAQEAGPAAVLDEVRGMVHLLHEAGIEVVLDVVYNHTCEGGDDQLHLSWRGLDNPLYYLHDGGTPAALADVTGTGNTLDFRRPRVIQMALDSLRYWAQEVGVDGFRFDLATTLGRGSYGFTAEHPFLVALQTDPVLSGLKLIAEPWDVGPGGWQTGSFPPPMAEWNDRFRDAVRGFWLASAAAGAAGRPMEGVRELSTRLAGSADLFGHSDPPLVRGPVASVNYVTAHDGFTLADLVAYDRKHNWANGEDNRDGTGNNLSWNHGVEGHSAGDDTATEPWSAVVPMRRRSQRNLLAMLLLAAGTPMITAGDEVGRSQQGNNNAYAQDSEISWVRRDHDDAARDLLATTRFLLGLRREHPALRADSFFLGAPRRGETRTDLLWFTETGEQMDTRAWDEPGRRVVQMLRPGPGETDCDVLLVLNGRLDDLDVKLPPLLEGAGPWERVWSSTWDAPEEPAGEERCSGSATMDALSVQVFLARRG
ncbi:glycogen debranching enzyme GlgX [Xylanimonas oleitrophica]|uniref:Glycogen debranching enzyme GlgX n=1 Tax=Xylanimonas oleitrophica TaxID=2607479 RepID=A0A2W5WLZ8_9MICO|nr:glycogen debranching protein GlgX [Xylanimonas oleitrophica]PZR52022.1 glycogen debranching enzyme GlgX [Xylanimonas oleitrophica]